jgi:circadian clock protein KaiB
MLELVAETNKSSASVSSDEEIKWRLRLYIAGQTVKSIVARTNLKTICEQYMPGRYHVDVIDLLVNPQLARSDQILAIPTLVRELPIPMRKIIGDLSNTERVLMGLDIYPVACDEPVAK